MTPEIHAAVERLRNYGRYPEPYCTAQPIIDYRADLALLADAADAGARAREQAIEEENKALREMLWLRHGCLALYGDDGEMQCGKCVIDFKRAEPQQIAARFEQIGRAALLQAEAPRAAGGAQP